MHSLLYDFMLTTVRSSRAPRLRVLGIVYTSCSSLRTLDSRAPRLRVLASTLVIPLAIPPVPSFPAAQTLVLLRSSRSLEH